MNSSFGGMLNMFGGVEALTPLKEPFIKNMQSSLIAMSAEKDFQQKLVEQIESEDSLSKISDKIASIIDARLAELTPSLVKQIMQAMIKEHLGWLVIWGGVFGALIGFLSHILMSII